MPRSASTPALVLVILATALCAGLAILLATQGHGAIAAIVGGIGASVLAIGLGLVLVLRGLDEHARLAQRALSLHEQIPEALSGVRQSLDLLRSTSALSDRAKGVLGRAHERIVLASAIEEEARAGRIDAAWPLLRTLQPIDPQQASTLEAMLRRVQLEGPGTLASTPADTPALLGPEPTAPTPAPPSADDEQRALKEGLEAAFHEAARSGRTDDAMMLLAQLDTLITPDEAEGLQAIAREVVAKAREGLGEKFRAAIHDKRWHDAVSIGEQIVRQFPNSRMANEAAGLLPTLRERAGA